MAAAAAAAPERYACLVALGAVIRGDTPHFDYVAGETSRGLGAGGRARIALPVGFGLLTVDTMEQAADRAGGSAGNKGHEAAAAAHPGGRRHRPAAGASCSGVETKSRARALQLLYAWEMQGEPPDPGVATRAVPAHRAGADGSSTGPRRWRPSVASPGRLARRGGRRARGELAARAASRWWSATFCGWRLRAPAGRGATQGGDRRGGAAGPLVRRRARAGLRQRRARRHRPRARAAVSR